MLVCVDATDKYIRAQVGYGLGVRKLLLKGETLVGHTGSLPGYSGITMHNVQKNITITATMIEIGMATATMEVANTLRRKK